MGHVTRVDQEKFRCSPHSPAGARAFTLTHDFWTPLLLLEHSDPMLILSRLGRPKPLDLRERRPLGRQVFGRSGPFHRGDAFRVSLGTIRERAPLRPCGRNALKYGLIAYGFSMFYTLQWCSCGAPIISLQRPTWWSCNRSIRRRLSRLVNGDAPRRRKS